VKHETASGAADWTRSLPARRSPRVSIGLPVYNGERYLEAALESLLAQTFTDFELIISDNASTDETPAICRAYAARDRRVRYSRLDRNIGGSPNHNRVLELSVGEYFTWGSHDDLRAPEHLTRCVAVLDQNPGVVLCFSRVQEIDELGAPIPTPAHREFLANVGAHDPCKRWRHFVHDRWVYDPIYGVIRRDALGCTGLLGTYAGSDRVTLGELALHGRFHRIEERLFCRRIHAGQSSRVFPSCRARVAWNFPDRTGNIVFPIIRVSLEWFRALARVPLPWPVRVRCARAVARWALNRRQGMVDELDFAARVIAQRAVRRWPRLRQQAAP
jgi:glycosyltransferase involved in cell wall biosynthesis